MRGRGNHVDGTYNHILVALDGSEAAEQILPQVQMLQRTMGSRVTLISVVSLLQGLLPEPSHADLKPVLQEVEGETQSYLNRVAERLQREGGTVDVEYPEGAPAETIVRRATELQVDLLALTTRGRGGIDRTLFGSVADKVLRTAPCPILLVRMT